MKPEEIINSVMNTVPKTEYLPEWNPDGEYTGIKAFTYDGIERKGKKTKIFAYIGKPETGEKTPAILLIHGGGGHPFLPWVKMWVERGYTALAIETTGHFPREINAGAYDGDNIHWKYGLYGSFDSESYTNAPDNDGMSTSTENDGAEMWMTHALCGCILGANLLRADGLVNPDKIGVTGISWGGVITSLLIGFDTRFAFAVPVYGSGYLAQARAWIRDNFNTANTDEYWLAEDRFDNVKIPVLWLCWNEDNCFSINSNSKSYVDTVKNNKDTRLCIKDKMYHSHVCGWVPDEIYAFARSVVSGGEKLPEFITQPDGFDINCKVGYSGSAKALLYYFDEPMSYSVQLKNNISSTYLNQQWNKQELTVSTNTVNGRVPGNACCYYIELTVENNGQKNISTSVFVEIKA